MKKLLPNVEQTVFFVSTGRTATKAIAHYFSAFSDTTAVHEPGGSRLLRPLANMHACGRVTTPTMDRIFSVLRTPSLKRVSTPVYIEASPLLRGCLQTLADLFENPLLIHVVRNPATYIPSYINHGAFHGVKGLVGNRLPYWMPKPEECGDRRLRWSAMPVAERAAWRWAFINRMIEDGAAIFPGRYHRVRYEDLFHPQRRGLEELARVIGIEPPEDDAGSYSEIRVNASRVRRFPPVSEWEQDTRERVLSHCGALMQRYGYRLEDEA